MFILLAVSGGVDSMYLANRAPELFPGARFAVAHCNFSLRGEESDGDEAFVRSWCGENDVECFVKRFDTAGYASEHHVSIEMAARELRYEWFSELCKAHGFDALATAHNANDNAETLILNLLRGTGSRGLRGIASCTQIQSGAEACTPAPRRIGPENVPLRVTPPTDFVSGPLPLTEPRVATVFQPDCRLRWSAGLCILRPMLEITREEIEKWMRENGKQWREDSTNRESVVKRNVIRNEVFPIFGRLNPSYIQTLNADMKRFTQADDIAEDYLAEAVRNVCDEKGIIVDRLLELKHWRYVLFRLTEECGFCADTFEKLTELLERFKDRERGTVTLGGKTFEGSNCDLKAVRGRLIIYK